MRATVIGLTLVLCAAVLSAQEPPSMLQYLRARSDVTYTDVPRKVLAFYYPWYATPDVTGRWGHWTDVDTEAQDIASSTHYPLGGPYDSHDPTVIDRHVTQAQACGIDGFISSWWGPGDFTDQMLPALLERSEESDFEVTVYWETAPGEGQAQIARAVSDLVYIVENYGSHPAFMKLDDRPVIFVYGRVMGQVPLQSWPAIVTGVRERVEIAPVLIADGYRADFARVLDGVHTYNVCGWVAHHTPDDIREQARRRYGSAVETARSQRRIACLTVIPGYDDTKIREPGLNAVRHDGETYRVLWEEAIAAQPDWVLITSWNEWHEGSEIEPSVEYGDAYLAATRELTAEFATAPPADYADIAPAGMTAEQRAELAETYEGATIGLLPGGASEVLLMIADAGLEARELTMEEVVDPEVLSAERIPVLIYGAGERYQRTVNEEGDVDRALMRYLSDGGVLVVASHQPFPFFYDADGAAVNNAQALGLPVTMGWETPPEAEDLHFEVNPEALEGLPERVAFPDSGDLRWRPADGSLLAEGDLYLPLASLTDASGERYGEGIAWIEHRESEPVGGRLLYCWMRMPDILPPGDLYFALLRMVGGEMAE